MRTTLFALCLLSVGCTTTPLEGTSDGGVAPDLAITIPAVDSSTAVDLSANPIVDLSANATDGAMPRDGAVPRDGASPQPDMRGGGVMAVVECNPIGIPIEPLKGSRQLVVSSFQVAAFNEGFDLSGDGRVDNVLSPMGAIVNASFADAFTDALDFVMPFELYGYSGGPANCVKMAMYSGRVVEDRDGDTSLTSRNPIKADCDDTNPAIHPGAHEDLTNGVDDDCDGYADNPTGGVKPTSNQRADADGDGVAIAQGDCDDRADAQYKTLAAARHPGASEICNGIDDDCDGVPDNGPACDPFADNVFAFHALAASFTNAPMGLGWGQTLSPAGLVAASTFINGDVSGGVYNARGNSLRIASGTDEVRAFAEAFLDLSAVRARLTLTETARGTYAVGTIGGVAGAAALDRAHLPASSFLRPEQSLLDATFAGPVATILGLNSDRDGHYLPDIDLDGDGLETFWSESATVKTDGGVPLAVIDHCRDGDGTVITGIHCATAVDANGVPRFVDGLSIALKIKAVPAKITDVVGQ